MEEVEFILTPLWGLAETDLAGGDANASIARCEEGYDIAVRTGERALFIPFVVTGARAYLAAHRPGDAETWVGRAREHLAGWDPIAGQRPSTTPTASCGSRRARCRRRARRSSARSAAGTNAARVWEATWARLDLAYCLIRMNRHGESVALIGQVRETADSLGSPPLQSRADELARTSRARGTTEEAWWPLTAREFEVARLVAEGLTNAEIAERLTIAPKTASAHIEHILAKLGVTRRAEIAAWAASVARPIAPSAAESGASGVGIAARR